ncbi:uncharacterized protein LDX57_009171 [Aspergillus melleus]|uniref:uncharacterized protein n=1 Tax=Aspergillus melleus TaxID=138277 RepID=UPI001E8D2C1A|nr:uncharacterized protein LDX57_009171 [Aspergillus melleus]KAH8431508.1 hypothetical protein LDX57_009171 [Aspergillus melleus]
MRLLWLLLAWLAFGDAFERSKCGPQIEDENSSSSSSSSKRSVGYLRIDRNVTRTAATTTALAKRMKQPEGTSLPALYDFYGKELPYISNTIVTRDKTKKDPTWLSAALMLEYDRTRRREFSTGIEGLKGCTALYIISRKAVYGAHYWESVSFAPEKIWLNGDPKLKKQELFELTVTDMLKNGGKLHAPLVADKIEDDHIKAYLIRPSKVFRQFKNPQASDYTKQWNQIKATVGELVPTLADPDRWYDVKYYPAANNKELDKVGSVRGKSLFKFDKADETEGGHTQKKAMLWFEDRLVHGDAW